MTLGDEEKEQKAVRVELTAMKHALEQIRLAALALARRAESRSRSEATATTTGRRSRSARRWDGAAN